MKGPSSIVRGVYLLDLGVSQAYLWDRGDGLTLIDTGIVGSEVAIVEGVRISGVRRRTSPRSS